MPQRQTYILTLQPQPGGPPDEIRLRRIPKDLLRRHGVRLIDIRETPTNPERIDDADDERPI